MLSVLAAACALAFTTAASADTIYMKNGRTIVSSHVRVEGDRVIFLQYGGEVSLPLSMVDRIVEDTEVEPEATPLPPPPPAGDPALDPALDPSADVPPEQTREYWQDKVAAIVAEREQVTLQIEDLRRTERAFLFSHRSTAETRAQIEAQQTRMDELDQEMSTLQADARRAQVPAGWLRLDPSGGAPAPGGGTSGAAGGRGGRGGSGGPGDPGGPGGSGGDPA